VADVTLPTDASLPLEADAHEASAEPPTLDRERFGQVVLVLQGGGALGAYQGGVFQALAEAGIAPDWVIGTSIGAINAALIAGNLPERRLERLTEFWSDIRQTGLAGWMGAAPLVAAALGTAATVAGGVRGFFEPNPAAWLGANWPLGPEAAGYYSCAPLLRTLERLVDVNALNAANMRLTVGAANVRTGAMRYFDSQQGCLSLAHVMASSALPPAFPAVRIDGELYWDGGVLSNTPVEAVFDDNPRRSGLVFSVHVWNPQGDEPDTLAKVVSREKDLRYASRTAAHIERQRQIHKLRHVIAQLERLLPDDVRARPETRALTTYGCVTRMHVVRLLAPPLYGETHSKDIDFTASGIRQRWRSGYRDTVCVLQQAPWTGEFDPLEGFVLHEAASDTAATA